MGDMGGVTIRDSLGRTRVPISCQIGKCSSIKVFYQIVTSDVLTSLYDNLIKCYFDKLGHVLCIEYKLELQRKIGVFWNVKDSSI